MSDTNKKTGANKMLWIIIAAIVVLAIVLTVIATTSGGRQSGGSNDAITDGTSDSAVEVYEGPEFYLTINADGGNTHIYSGHVRL
ncbi:MAG: hypothetical protein IJC18_00360, partial [Clostridia bacterium]|nr:hypothetical protein [Clostridia bacterium]